MPTQTEPRSEPRSVQTLRNAGAPLVPKALPLTEEMLLRFQERAPGYDQQNRFFTEDFEELRASGYLNMAIPRELGGLGMTLAEVSREQRRLGYYAPADALAVNMHLYWTGLAADLWRAGDKSLDGYCGRRRRPAPCWPRGTPSRGTTFPCSCSTTRAEYVEGGYRFYGRKRFGSLTPVWTLLGIHGIDTSDPAHPMIVHGFLPRDGEGFKVVETWDTLGMPGHPERRHRARRVRSCPTGTSPGAFRRRRGGRGCVRPGRLRVGTDRLWEHLLRAGPPGAGSHGGHGEAEEVHWPLPPDGLPRGGAARRGRDGARDGGDRATPGCRCAGVVRWRGPRAGLGRQDRRGEVPRGGGVVAGRGSHALELAGGFGIFRQGPFERLFRDARLGRIHPANSMLTHELAAKLTLGINPDEAPRWG